MSIESIENQLITLTEQLGSIAENNSNYTCSLAKHIKETGKPIANLTIVELLALNTQHKAFFNSSLPENTSHTLTKYKAKQVMQSLEYILLSIKTIQNDIQALSGLDQEVITVNKVTK